MSPFRELFRAVFLALVVTILFPSTNAYMGYCGSDVIAQTGMTPDEITAAVAACGATANTLAAEVTDEEMQTLSDSLMTNGATNRAGEPSGFDVSAFCHSQGVNCFYSEVNDDNIRGGRTTGDSVVVYKAVFPTIESLTVAAAAVGLTTEIVINDCPDPTTACRTGPGALLRQIQAGLRGLDSEAPVAASPRATAAARTSTATSRTTSTSRTAGAAPRG